VQRRSLFLLLVPFLLFTSAVAQSPNAGPATGLPGLKAAAQITRDAQGVAHIQAATKHDLFFLQGYVHAQDRLFQMDLSRRQASGTLAELLGPGALPSDVQLRTLGLRRAAVGSLAALSPQVRAALQAYADGVNAFVASHPLPPEYGVLEITQFQPWTPLDSVVIGKLIAFGLSFDLDIDLTVSLLTYQQAGAALGFDGTALFFQDLFRSAPFDPASTVPDASVPMASSATSASRAQGLGRGLSVQAASYPPGTLALCQQYLDTVKQLPVFQRILDREKRGGSNEFAVSGALTVSGRALLASDPHLALDTPSTFYPNHLTAGAFNVTGVSFPGAPGVILGHNRHISWGATVNPMDVTDTFIEQVVVDLTSPSGLSIVHQGQQEPILPIPEVFRQNNLGDAISDNITVVPPGGPIPPVTLIVPRRNNGPIVQLDVGGGMALSVQYTGFSPTRELETFLTWNEATGLADFMRGLQFFDFGSQNFAYSDIRGNIAYFTSGEMPIREDLQAGVVNGLPPYFLRNGTGGNEWLPVQNPQPGQAVPFEILPAAEMPHIINPPAGWFVNANNDPIGTTLDNNPLNQLRPGGGIFYLNPGYDGIRGGRITQMIRERLATSGKISFQDMQQMQADVTLLDAQFFAPHIAQALANAGSSSEPLLAAFAANPAIQEAVGRMAAWDFTTPTGIPEGFDSSDIDGNRFPPSSAEIDAGVAATLYSVWRGQFIRNTIDAPLVPFGLPTPPNQQALTALRNLLENFSVGGGVGASGISFFNVPGVASAADRRDILILKSLADALGRLAGAPFAAAFNNSTNQGDYRWGKLHRIVFDHPLGGPFSIPPAGGLFPAPLPGLSGIPTDGGFSTVDASSHNARGDSVNSFMFGSGPTRRFVSEGTPGHMRAESSLPGGTSGILGSPFYFNLLPEWLTNDAHPLLLRKNDVQQNAAAVIRFVPAP